MKQAIFTLFFLVSMFAGFTQRVRLLSLDELYARTATGKDTTYAINFWATWCRPCIAELPYFEAINDSLKHERVKVLLVSVDFLSVKESTLEPFVQKKGYESELFILNEKNENEWINRVSPDWSGAIPATLIINTAGNHHRFYEQDFSNYQELYSVIQPLIQAKQ